MPKTLFNRVGLFKQISSMKQSSVNLQNLLNELSENKINRVVDEQVIKAGWTGSCGSSEHSDRSVGSSSNPGLHLGNGH